TETSIADLAGKIIALTGRPVEIQVDPQRLRPEKSEVHRLLSDPTRAHQLLAWKAPVGLEEGLQRTIAWIHSHLDLYRPNIYAV
ncbi:MAG: hypothetical protein P8X95_21700, partial [Anaerolineales bacterium]